MDFSSDYWTPLSSSQLNLLEWLLSKDLINLEFIKAIDLILIIVALLPFWSFGELESVSIIAGLGLFGVAVALGAQDLFKDLISGILVLVEEKVSSW